MNRSRPLSGIRVVDFCWILAGPIGTRLLASFGAEVIRVESRTRPDAARRGERLDGSFDDSLGFLHNDVNAGKLSLAVDLSQVRGRALVRRLIERADVVTDNFRPGVLSRLGFAYEELREINPRLVVAHMPGCGSRGPWSNRATLGNLIMAASGLNFLTGFPGRPPRGLGVAFPDFTSPYLFATLILAALREREQTGEGREIDLSQLSATISLLGADWLHFSTTGREPGQRSNRDPNYCPHGVYRTAGDDEWCAVAVSGDEEWRALCMLMERPELIEDSRFRDHASRKAHEDEVDSLVSLWAARLDGWELAKRLQKHGIAAAPVESLRDMLERDPQLTDHYQTVQQPSEPDFEITIDREAIRIDGVTRALTRAPMVGEHSEHVLCDIVGLDRDEFDELIATGVLQ